MAAVYNIPIPALLGDVIRRWGMFGIMVLAMVPAIQSGIGPNFGISLGIVGGLLGSLISIEMRDLGYFAALTPTAEELANGAARLDDLASIAVALGFAIFSSGIFGFLYGLLLNRVKGSEMLVSTYVGFSMVALFNIMWLVLPFRSGTSIWPIAGEGLRTTISLADDFGGVFNDLLAFNLGGMNVPTGLLLVFFLACLIVWLFTRSRLGMMMSAAGSNPNYAKAVGINVNRMRILGTTLSTILGGVGIIAFAQSFGFLQLYNAPLMMGFMVVASVLVGGASVAKARILHVLIGTFLFQGILTVAIPVANEMVPEGNLSEILRMIISNGIILYALTKSREAAR